MRFTRNAKIFRGQIDAAPFAGLFFMMVVFMMLFGARVFIPGVPITFADRSEIPEPGSRTVSIATDGSISFNGNVFTTESLEKHLRDLLRTGNLPGRLLISPAPGADAELEEEVRLLLSRFGVSIKSPGQRLEIPPDAGFPGYTQPSVVVSINLNGQIFFEHQRIQEAALQDQLENAIERLGAPVSVILQADKDVPYQRITQLCGIARKAGIMEVLLAHRPNPDLP